jgi:hypothetical protein
VAKLSIAASGGGHRATLFALGALQYVADAGTNRSTVSITSVSGGSITNGFIGQQVPFADVDGAGFQRAVTDPLTAQLTRTGTLFGSWITKVYLVVLVVAAVVALVGPWFITALHWGLRVVVFVVALLAVAVLAGFRGRVCRAAFRDTLFSPDGGSTELAAMHPGVDHVICSTELSSGDHVYFARDLAYSYQHGCGTPGTVDIATAVAASAALPMAFPPLSVRTAGLELTGGHRGADAHTLHLVDGGVYDNMGDQWAAGYRNRVRRLPAHYVDREPDELIVVNASAGKPWVDRRGLHLPVIRELVALMADQGIQYDNTTSHRRTALIARFELAAEHGGGLRGTYVGINQSPFRVADAMIGHPERSKRARAVLERLGDTPDARAAWDVRADTSATEGTHLSKMSPDRVADIVHHAYVVTMCNAHVILGHPLLELPDRDRFMATARRTGSPT